jgi:microcystin-dependent protein
VDNYLAEIRIFGFNYAPSGWAFCNGQLLPISQFTALFSLIGTYYGGNGTSNFALPNLQASVPISQGQSPGTSVYYVGEDGGTPAVTLGTGEMPAHNHGFNVSTRPAKARQPGGQMLAVGVGPLMYNTVQQPTTMLDPQNAVGPAGSNLPHNNMMPFLTLNFCIALQGIYPPRTAEEPVLAVRDPEGDIEVLEGDALPADPTLVVFGPTDE